MLLVISNAIFPLFSGTTKVIGLWDRMTNDTDKIQFTIIVDYEKGEKKPTMRNPCFLLESQLNFHNSHVASTPRSKMSQP
jgi:hypothetical protein